MRDQLTPIDGAAAGLVAREALLEQLMPVGKYHVECVGADGRVKWRDVADNLVTTQGKNAILDKFLGLAAAYTNIALGLHTTVGNAASTYAAPSPQVEAVVGTYTARLAPAFSAAAAGVKATSAAVSFPIVGTDAINGVFLALANAAGVLTRGDVAASGGVLLSTGTFSGGARAVLNGDTLNVTYSLAL